MRASYVISLTTVLVLSLSLSGAAAQTDSPSAPTETAPPQANGAPLQAEGIPLQTASEAAPTEGTDAPAAEDGMSEGDMPQDEAARNETASDEAAPNQVAQDEAAQDEAAPNETAQDEAVPDEVSLEDRVAELEWELRRQNQIARNARLEMERLRSEMALKDELLELGRERNAELYAIALEIAEKFIDPNAAEPFFQFRRVKMENLKQSYEDRLRAARIYENTLPPSLQQKMNEDLGVADQAENATAGTSN